MKRGLRMLINIQRPPPLALRAIIPMSRKAGKNTRRPTWVNKELLAKFKHKKGSIQKAEVGTGNLGEV